MPEEFEVQVTGLKEVADTLDQIPYKFASRIQRTALQAGGEVFKAAAEALAPIAPEASHKDSEPGELKRSIGVVVHLGKNLDSSTVRIGPLYDKTKYSGGDRTHSPGVYGKLVEYGTAKMAPEPYMRPAYQAARQNALDAYTKVVTALLKLLTDSKAQDEAVGYTQGFEE